MFPSWTEPPSEIPWTEPSESDTDAYDYDAEGYDSEETEAPWTDAPWTETGAPSAYEPDPSDLCVALFGTAPSSPCFEPRCALDPSAPECRAAVNEHCNTVPDSDMLDGCWGYKPPEETMSPTTSPCSSSPSMNPTS